MVVVLVILISVFLAINMGASGFAVSFTPSYGSNILKKNQAVLLYTLCVLLGGIFVGPRVGETLMKKMTSFPLGLSSGIIILVSSSITMVLSNLLKVPQSTSFVTVAGFVGAGYYYGSVHWSVVLKIFVVSLIFSLSSFLLTVFIKRKIYPPHQKNLMFYERFLVHKAKLRRFIVLHDLYAGFALGTNNVANVAAPVLISLTVNPFLAFLCIGPLFGAGAFFLGERVIRTVSKEIVPIGEISAGIVSLITASFVLAASFIGLPTSFVQLATFSLFGISCIKDGFQCTLGKSAIKKILSVWIFAPLFAASCSFILHSLFLK